MSEKTTKEQVFEMVKSAYGFVPNLIAAMAEHNPATAGVYLAGSGALSGGSLSPEEQQVVMLAVSAYNECHYCTAAHRTAAKGMGVSQADLEAIDDKRDPSDERLLALVNAAWTVQEKRGNLDKTAQAALDVNTTELYEIVAIVGLKTISNYINHIAQTQIDAPFQAQAKRRPARLTS